MELVLYGKKIVYDDQELGFYVPSNHPILRSEYGKFDFLGFVKDIGDTPISRAVECLTWIRDLAREQSILKETPQNKGWSAGLRQCTIGPDQRPEIDQVRDVIVRTERFITGVLEALAN